MGIFFLQYKKIVGIFKLTSLVFYIVLLYLNFKAHNCFNSKALYHYTMSQLIVVIKILRD